MYFVKTEFGVGNDAEKGDAMVLVSHASKVIVQGFTGKEATFHAQQCIEYGTQIVGGVTPFKGGETHLGLPVFNTVKEAVAATKAEVSLVFVPPRFVASAIAEAAEAGIKLAVIITEHTPVKDMLQAKAFANKCGMKIIGPNCPGLVSTDSCKLGIMPNSVFARSERNVGIISKSGTLTYEGAKQASDSGFGVSTAVGIGGDSVIGMTYEELLPLFEADEASEAVVMIGEIGGTLEIAACEVIKKMTKPVVAFIAGKSAPKGKRMGHAGAIIGGAQTSAEGKMAALRQAGAIVVESPSLIGEALAKALKK